MSLRLRIQAIADLLARYAAHGREHWTLRKQLAGPSYSSAEAEFLPGALAIIERPVSPTARVTGRLLVLLLFSAIAWACFSKVDIVTVADGKVVVSGRTKSIAAVETAVVRAIHVREGQHVFQGQSLIELDSGVFEADERRAEADMTSARIELERSRALLAAIDEQHKPTLPRMLGGTTSLYADAQSHLEGQYRDYQAKLATLDATIERFSAALPLAQERTKSYAELVQNQDVSKSAYSEKLQGTLELAGQLEEARKARESLVADTRKQALEAANQASRTIAIASQDAARAKSHERQMTLQAPASGTVQQLSAHTIGGVAAAADTLMYIVPDDDPMEVDASVENKDVGFIAEGQSAQIKIDAYDYTRHGFVDGRVSQVSRDAVADEKRGWIYHLRVVLSRDAMTIDGRTHRLMAGMTVKVEVRTGRRRVINYLLDPILRHASESLRER